jgi:hypothetical protein
MLVEGLQTSISLILFLYHVVNKQLIYFYIQLIINKQLIYFYNML